MAKQARFNEADGIAALGICESLLIALTELKVIVEQDARDVLTDVAAAHTEAAHCGQALEKHREVVQKEALKRLKAGESCRAIAKTYRVHHATIARLAA